MLRIYEKGRWSHSVPERQVAGLWQQRLTQDSPLTTTAGERLEVRYPGRGSGGDGPDFRDAVVVLNGERQLKGDIELHVHSRQWLEHGHHLCPSYDHVVLHVVLWDDGVAPALLPDAVPAPVLALAPQLQPEAAPPPATLPCRDAASRLGPPRLQELLTEAGEARFHYKASRFQHSLEQAGADQALYEGLLEALGYTKNKAPFLELARALPWQLLGTLLPGRVPRPSPDFERCISGMGPGPIPEIHGPRPSRHGEASPEATQDLPDRTLRLQALLLGAAGLLPRQGEQSTSDPYVEVLLAAWRQLKPEQPLPPLTLLRDQVRPDNLPVRRLAGVGVLLARYLDCGLASGLVELVAKAGTEDHLGTALTVAATGFWASHLDFGIVAKGGSAPALIGQGRASDMVVNVVLPFVWAWAESNAYPALQARALQLYHSQPRLQGNTITRHMMRQLGIAPKAVTSAAQQQGLLHIYKTGCTQGECPGCRLTPV